MKYLIGLAIVAGFFLWLYGSGNDSTVTVYAIKRVEKDRSDQPEWLPLNKSTYKIEDNNVIEKTGLSIKGYENCNIISIDDWKCTYDDKSGSFGMIDGEFWRRPPIEEFEYVSRIRYQIENCKWDFYSGGLQVVACPLRFVSD